MENLDKKRNFNFALFLGLFVVALGIFAAGRIIAENLPHSFHGHLTGSMTYPGTAAARDFMSEWEAAIFLLMNQDEFANLLSTGELAGTYTVFQIERMTWQFAEGENRVIIPPAGAVPAMPVPRGDYEMREIEHRVFSRELLNQWLMARIAGGQ